METIRDINRIIRIAEIALDKAKGLESQSTYNWMCDLAKELKQLEQKVISKLTT